MTQKDKLIEAVANHDYRTAIRLASEMSDGDLLGWGPTIRRGITRRGSVHEIVAARQSAVSAIEAFLRGEHA